MAKYRKSMPPDLKEKLVKEAGMKCANPGCSNYRTHIHHIREWAVYQSHNESDMIAICPSCHDSAHYGKLSINDETLYQWKKIHRNKFNRDQLFVEPGTTSKLLIGSIAVTGNNGISVFEFSPQNKLGFKLVDNDIFLINMSISNLKGQEIFKVVENHAKYNIQSPLEFKRRPGRVCVTAPAIDKYIPIWVIPQIYKTDPSFFVNGRFTVIDIEVLKPGLVRTKGLWIDQLSAVCITDEHLVFLSYGRPNPVCLCGAGEDSVIHYNGPIDKSLFKIGE